MTMRKVWFYNPPENTALATLEAMASDTDVICMTMGVEREQWLRDLRNAGFKGSNWLYWLQNSVHMAEVPNRNNVGYKAGTFEDLRNRTPDVFQRHPNGQIVLKNLKQDYAVCDVAHPAWRDLFKARTIQTVQRNPDLWTGIWDDDLNTIFHVNGVGPVETRNYGKADSPAYFSALLDWLTYQRNVIASPLGLRFGGNLQGSDLTRWQTAVEIMSKYGIGPGVVMNEHQFLSHEGEYLSLSEWQKDLRKVEIATLAGAEVWNVCPVDAKKAYENPDGAEMAKVYFFVASHLLAADRDTAAVRIGRNYANWYPFDLKSISAKLGKPKAPYKAQGGEYSREFEGGAVTVRPADQFASISYAPVQPSVITIKLKNVTLTYELDE